MIPVKYIFDSVAKDDVNVVENGSLGFDRFNRYNKRAQLKVMDYLTGDIEGILPPMPYTTDKLRDFLSPFTVAKTYNVNGGRLVKPKGYYKIDSLSSFKISSDCGKEGENCKVDIDILDSTEFNKRCTSSIVGLRPTFDEPIARMTNDGFEFAPKDIGFVELTCIRYPEDAYIVAKEDPIYGRQVIDEALSTDYEFGDWATELLIYFITQMFAKHTREDALAQHNNLVGKSVRDVKR